LIYNIILSISPANTLGYTNQVLLWASLTVYNSDNRDHIIVKFNPHTFLKFLKVK